MEKTCTKCGETKPLEEFHRFNAGRDGRRSECKVCSLARAKRNYDEKIRPTTDTGERMLTCRRCGKQFVYNKTCGRRRFYCGEDCKYRAGQEAKLARAGKLVRTCHCGSTDVARVGKPVCPEHRADPSGGRTAVRIRERVRTLSKYGLVADDWIAMVEAQDNRCAICRTDVPGGRGELWCIDHCHTTNVVRGLLCHNCNVGIGNFRDSPDLLKAAAAYLSR